MCRLWKCMKNFSETSYTAKTKQKAAELVENNDREWIYKLWLNRDTVIRRYKTLTL
jgi:hypothetical protein